MLGQENLKKINPQCSDVLAVSSWRESLLVYSF